MYKYNPYNIVKEFEKVVASYCGAPYAIAVDSCTSALFLCCKYLQVQEVIIPARTYLSVPQAIIQAGGQVRFENRIWKGIYQLKPYLIYDAAKRFTSGIYIPNSFVCLSFHIKKHLKIGKGGMILTDNESVLEWLKKARYEGRSEMPYNEDNIEEMGFNMYMTPQEAAHGLALMQNMPLHNDDLEEEYRDLREFELFKPKKIYYDSRYSSFSSLEE